MLPIKYLHEQSIEIIEEIEKSISGINYEKKFIARMKLTTGIERKIFAIANSENNIKLLTIKVKELQKKLIANNERLVELNKTLEQYDYIG